MFHPPPPPFSSTTTTTETSSSPRNQPPNIPTDHPFFPSPPNNTTTHTEYATFWSRVQLACQRYLAGVNEATVESAYAYLLKDGREEGMGVGVSGGDAESWTLGDVSTDDAGSHSVSLEFDMDVQSGGEGEGEGESNDERELSSLGTRGHSL
jgi:hypothetical protein